MIETVKTSIGRMYFDVFTDTLAQKLIKYALIIGALELVPERRKLKSGRMSPYFFNSGLFNTGDAMKVLSFSLIKSEWIVPEQIGSIVPFRAGTKLQWQLT